MAGHRTLCGRKDRNTMRVKWNKLLKSLLKTTVYILDQTAEEVDQAVDRASEIRDRARQAVDEAASAIHPQAEHTVRDVLSFVAGVGLGVAAGMLLAPASGAELRNSISDRVKDIGSGVRERGSSQRFATGTD